VTLDELLERAGKTVAGRDINETLHEIWEALDGAAVGYEMILDGRTFDDLLQRELPKLTEHFLAKRVPMLGAPFVILTLWHRDRAPIFSGDAFFDALALGLGITHDELRSRISRWRGDAGLPPDPWARPNEPAPIKGLLGPPEN
jgi:hypothetical protein